VHSYVQLRSLQKSSVWAQVLWRRFFVR
jgi:hypothetical protein